MVIIPVITGNEHTGGVYACFLANQAGFKDQPVTVGHCCSNIQNPLVGTLAGYRGSDLVINVLNKDSKKLENVLIGINWVNSIMSMATGTFIELIRGAVPSIKEVDRAIPGIGKLEGDHNSDHHRHSPANE